MGELDRRHYHAMQPNQSMKLTASKPAIYALDVCHPRVWFHGTPHGLAVVDLVSR
jgi:hypothetical protein